MQGRQAGGVRKQLLQLLDGSLVEAGCGVEPGQRSRSELDPGSFDAIASAVESTQGVPYRCASGLDFESSFHQPGCLLQFAEVIGQRGQTHPGICVLWICAQHALEEVTGIRVLAPLQIDAAEQLVGRHVLGIVGQNVSTVGNGGLRLTSLYLLDDPIQVSSQTYLGHFFLLLSPGTGGGMAGCPGWDIAFPDQPAQASRHGPATSASILA